MATLMIWGTSGGASGRCDAKCHNAKLPKCVCCCNGAFHGCGNRPGGVERVQEIMEAELGVFIDQFFEKPDDKTRQILLF